MATHGKREVKKLAERKPAAAEAYSSVAIVGLGLIGGSMALALKRSGYSGKITGVSSAATLEKAITLGAIDEGFTYDSLARAAAGSDLVVLAAPIAVIVEHLRVLKTPGAGLRPGTVVTDVGSTKRAILEAARGLPEHVHFIGGHPLAGSEQRGFTAADPFLFQNAYYVLTPAGGVPAEQVNRLTSFLWRMGARVVTLGADDHDRVAATISHLPQLLAVSLVRFLDELGPNRERGIQLAAGGFRDMTRIASSPFLVWKDIIATNGDVISDVLARFLERSRTLLGGLDEEALSESFTSAARVREEIPRDTRGFLTRLSNVLVLVEDKPGMIAGIAVALSEKEINIKDIEVLKVREGEGGTLRLAFASPELARQAAEVLTAKGFAARVRD